MTLTTIIDSHECPEYRAERYCGQIAQVSGKKKYCDIRLVGEVLSPIVGQILSLTLSMIPSRIAYKQPYI